MNQPLLEGEHTWLSSVVDDLTNDDLKFVYADWLEERGSERGPFLRRFAAASRSMNRDDFPEPRGFSEEWLELIGFRLVEKISRAGMPNIKEPLLRLARPALRLVEIVTDDRVLPVGASKVGGKPDLPTGFPWPKGSDCRAFYWKQPATAEHLAGFAGFLAQVNFAEIAGTCATRGLPQNGVLSFFGFQNSADTNVIGAKAVFFPDPSKLRRTAPPGESARTNREMVPSRLQFEEMFDLPDCFNSPWSEELNFSQEWEFVEQIYQLTGRELRNFLGYGHRTTGYDPTPSKDSRHLIFLPNSNDCYTSRG
jgi:uncharacterized protein (TIGR02996 family)